MSDDASNSAPQEDEISGHILKLYIYGRNARALRAIENLNHICESELQGKYNLEIIDIKENPDIAKDKMLVTIPTLIQELPLPIRRIVGDLSDREKVLRGLEIVPRAK